MISLKVGYLICQSMMVARKDEINDVDLMDVIQVQISTGLITSGLEQIKQILIK